MNYYCNVENGACTYRGRGDDKAALRSILHHLAYCHGVFEAVKGKDYVVRSR